jgi:hypothetical protein
MVEQPIVDGNIVRLPRRMLSEKAFKSRRGARSTANTPRCRILEFPVTEKPKKFKELPG